MVWSLITTILLLLVSSLGGRAQSVPKDDPFRTVEEFYFNAEFGKASKLLDEIDIQLASEPGGAEHIKKLRLYQALVAIALDDSETAKARFQQLLAIDSGFYLPSDQYSPKIIRIFTEARRTFDENGCSAACSECEAARKSGDLQKAVNIIIPFRSTCQCAQQISVSLSDSLVGRGRSAFQARDYAQAVNEFKRALEADPSNELAGDFSIVAAGQLRDDLRNAFENWRKSFDSQEYVNAKASYERVLRLSSGGESNAADEMRLEYQNLFNRYRDMWTQACARQDPLLAHSLRQTVRAIDPSGDLNRDVLSQIESCPAVGCTELPSVPVLERLSRKVYPNVDAALRPSSKIAVKIRIDNKGSVTVLDIDNSEGNAVVSQAVRDAVERWKFDPKIAARSRSQCVITRFFLEFER
jgi:TonB family protein